MADLADIPWVTVRGRRWAFAADVAVREDVIGAVIGAWIRTGPDYASSVLDRVDAASMRIDAVERGRLEGLVVISGGGADALLRPGIWAGLAREGMRVCLEHPGADSPVLLYDCDGQLAAVAMPWVPSARGPA